MRTIRWALLVVATTFVAGTAAAQKKCDPLPPSIAALSPVVYAACDVDKKAVPPRWEAVADIRLKSSGVGMCPRVTLDAVIETDDTADPSTARIIKTNDSTFAASVVQHLGEFTFRSATKDGHLVRQWLRFEITSPKRFAVARAGSGAIMPTENRTSC